MYANDIGMYGCAGTRRHGRPADGGNPLRQADRHKARLFRQAHQQSSASFRGAHIILGRAQNVLS